MAIASAAPAESAIVVGSDPSAASPLSFSEAPFKSRAIGQLSGACEPHGNFKALAGLDSRARRPRDDEPRPLQVGQPLGESARMVLNVHEAVQFPLDVVELGDETGLTRAAGIIPAVTS